VEFVLLIAAPIFEIAGKMASIAKATIDIKAAIIATNSKLGF
jgi:hypothetical protein